MPITLLAWISVFLFFCSKNIFDRPVWGVCLYLLVFFLFPPLWWWGKFLPDLRWSIFTALILVAGLVIHQEKNTTYQNKNKIYQHGDNEKKFINEKFIYFLLGLMLINYCFVHFFLAKYTHISYEKFDLAVKFIVIFFLFIKSIRSSDDILIIMILVSISLGYLGYQLNFTNAGNFVHGRLEGIPLPGARTSNQFASIIVAFTPTIGALFFIFKRKIFKTLVLISFPLTLNLLFLLNSRGAYLSIIAAAMCLAFLARKKERKILFIAALCSLIVLPVLAKDEKIYQRFNSIFVDTEERDSSAQSRILLWKAALDLISDYPMGTGGDGFRRVHGLKYASKYGIDKFRAVHNGYLSIACEWGIQGILIHLSLVIYIWYCAYKASQYLIHEKGMFRESFFVKTLLSGLFGFLIAAFFTTVLDEEWLFWMLAMLVVSCKLIQRHNFQIKY